MENIKTEVRDNEVIKAAEERSKIGVKLLRYNDSEGRIVIKERRDLYSKK